MYMYFKQNLNFVNFIKNDEIIFICWFLLNGIENIDW